ncbi:hypothetical protein ID47_04530 [Candidatus Paracaedibacter acanthamoebae]|uniref:Uncharacterized protein n=1 Tax=Candidatus Odyssella acanthamoebae TaxID=91604 RepID=A0A077ASI9_9PROT|nr:hypothetical protein ID47_04530 [Candidatus Paracaedibacter acanthamoebae]
MLIFIRRGIENYKIQCFLAKNFQKLVFLLLFNYAQNLYKLGCFNNSLQPNSKFSKAPKLFSLF